MSENQLRELIKEKELELRALKSQLKEIKATDPDNTVSYMELSKLELTEIENIVEKYNMKQIRKIYRQGNIILVPKDRNKAISDLIDMIYSRQTKGDAFKS